ncbi:MAG: hypothetical protein J8272_00735, partial ['Prunus persica' phytoplasma PP2]|nr:hypothetical protein ['Prunus persica' phytoplasma PP2]
ACLGNHLLSSLRIRLSVSVCVRITVASLRTTYVPSRQVGLAVKLASAFALEGQSRRLMVRSGEETSGVSKEVDVPSSSLT